MSMPLFMAALLLTNIATHAEKVPLTEVATSAFVSPHDQPNALVQAQSISTPSALIAASAASDGDAGASGEPGEIVVNARRTHTPGDPLEKVNAKSYALTQGVDDAVVGPTAHAYERSVPGPARDGLRNFVKNLKEPIVFLNFLLQLKPGKAAQTAVRFAINTTVGGAGLVDMARRRPFNLPRRANGFADTLGYYGVKPGPFFYIPLIGPTTLRDFIGGALDRVAMPMAVGGMLSSPGYVSSTGTVSVLDRRNRFDRDHRATIAEASDAYSARRDLYLRMRQAQIDELRGRAGVLSASRSREDASIPK